MRDKHELERRITELHDRTLTTVDEDYVHKLKKVRGWRVREGITEGFGELGARI